jgi:prepilin peptidase CpaA
MVCILSLSADTSPNIFLSLFVLFFGFMLFISKILGAGDVKLIVALSFAFNYVQFINYLFLVAVLGGVCAIIGLLFYHKNVKKNGIPYGVPIALAFMLSYPVG